MKAPWLNLKKLMLPASTTAITIVLLPALRAMKGLGLQAGTAGCIGGVGGKAHGNKRQINEGAWDEAGGTTACGAGDISSAATGRRCRGSGGGCSGSALNKSVSSWRVGIGVVRALFVEEGQDLSNIRYKILT